jgi:phage portal protein BeeE
MAWLTPVVREIEADGGATEHKRAFFENAATPNLAVSLPREITPEQFAEFVAKMDTEHAGAENAYKTLYTGGGADVTVIGANMRELDFKTTQGAGETRIAAAAGVHPVIVGLSEGLAGSSLNAGNFNSARRLTADKTLRPLWRNVCGSLETLAPPPGPDARLWFDARDVAFLRDDAADEANIRATEAQTIRNLIDAGYTPDSVTAAVAAGDWALLSHSGLFSVQLQAAGAPAPAITKAVP